MFGDPGRRLKKHLEAHGRSAPASIVEIARHGPTLERETLRESRYDVVLKTTLRVQPPGEPPFDLTRRVAWPADARPEAGAIVTVIYDPDDHDKWAIDHSARDARSAAGRQVAASIQEARRGGADLTALTQLAASSGLAMPPTVAPAPPAEAPDTISQLGRLADLRDSGVLTEEEFNTEKARILGSS